MIVGPAFATGLFGIADEENDRVRTPRGLHRLRDHTAVFGRVGEFDLVFPPIVVERDLDAFRMDDVRPVADQRTYPLQRCYRVTRDAVIPAQPRHIGIGADHRDGGLVADPLGHGERQHAVVLQQDERLFRCLTRQRDAFRPVRCQGGRAVEHVRLFEQAGIELHAQDMPDCGIDLRLRDPAFGQQLPEELVGRAVREIDIDSRIERQLGGGWNVCRDFVTALHFLDREIVGHDRAVIVPFAAQDVA